MNLETSDSTLEQFRRQWREEVSTRAKDIRTRPARENDLVDAGVSPLSEPPPEPARPTLKHHEAVNLQESENRGGCHEEDGTGISDQFNQLTFRDTEDGEFTTGCAATEPKSALEHYEWAVEKENQGNLGDSLSHYRKAYRLDVDVDVSYKNKHFPTKPKPSNPNPSNVAVTIPPTTDHSSKEPVEQTSISTLIASFSGQPILGAPPAIDGDRPPPCPISRLPSEILLGILRSMAILDPASFARSAVVCKRFAYHVFTENQIWKRVALGPEFGLAGQMYEFQTDIQGRKSINRALGSYNEHLGIDETVIDDPSNRDWREIFHSHPRIRFTGVYISTVNYTRAGGPSASQLSWNSQVNLVTYYRYLRFFRDGTVISLLSTNEPIEVVHQLTKENMALVRGEKEHHPLNFTSSAPAINGPAGLTAPQTAHQLMKHALRGRWRLWHPSAAEQYIMGDVGAPDVGRDGDVYIETEGAGPRYVYIMKLALRSSSKSKYAVKNNKLKWKGFHSYIKPSNDWAPFQLKNDRAFFFSRVKSYGLGY